MNCNGEGCEDEIPAHQLFYWPDTGHEAPGWYCILHIDDILKGLPWKLIRGDQYIAGNFEPWPSATITVGIPVRGPQ